MDDAATNANFNYYLPTIVIEQHDLHEKYRQKPEELELTM